MKYLHPRPHIWHIKLICDVNEEKILKIAIFDILVVLWAYNCLWQLLADWKIKNFCCHTKTLRSIITLSNVAVSFTIIRACVYQIWGLGCKWFKSYDQKRDFTLFWKLTGSFCTAVLRKIRLCYWLLNYDDLFSEIANIKGLIYVDEIAIIKMTSNYHNFGATGSWTWKKTTGSVKIRGFRDIAPKFAQFEVIFMIAISSTYIRPFMF